MLLRNCEHQIKKMHSKNDEWKRKKNENRHMAFHKYSEPRMSVTYHSKSKMCSSDKCMPHFDSATTNAAKYKCFLLWVMNVKFWSFISSYYREKEAANECAKWKIGEKKDRRARSAIRFEIDKQQTRCKFVFIHRDKWLHSRAVTAAADSELNAKCFRISGHVQYIPCMWYDEAIWK